MPAYALIPIFMKIMYSKKMIRRRIPYRNIFYENFICRPQISL